MLYRACGCTAPSGLSFEASEPYDGAWCPRTADLQHLWVRHPQLVVPTLACRIQEASRGGIQLVGWHQALPAGDWPLHQWRRHDEGIQVILAESAPVDPTAELVGVA